MDAEKESVRRRGELRPSLWPNGFGGVRARLPGVSLRLTKHSTRGNARLPFSDSLAETLRLVLPASHDSVLSRPDRQRRCSAGCTQTDGQRAVKYSADCSCMHPQRISGKRCYGMFVFCFSSLFQVGLAVSILLQLHPCQIMWQSGARVKWTARLQALPPPNLDLSL